MTTNYLEVEKLTGEQHTALGEHAYAGSETCLLEEEDLQCGHIFFNESSRLLKFFCSFCRETFDNINYFCEHLSTHINDNSVENNEEEAEDVEDEQYIVEADQNDEQLDDLESADLAKVKAKHVEVRKTKDIVVIPGANEGDIDIDDFEDFDALDDAEQIAAEVEEEMRQAEDAIYIDDDSMASDFLGYDDERSPPKLKESAMDFEKCFVESLATGSNQEIEEIDGFNKQNEDSSATKPGVKKKRVTTVKVIASKNRVAELYEQIKEEEEKRSKMALATKNAEENNHIEFVNDDGLVRKIIGETVITLLPDPPANPPGSTSPAVTPEKPAPLKRYHHNYRPDNNICIACGKEFSSCYGLSVHLRTHYMETKSAIKLAHKCSDCNKLFNRATELKEHIEKIHFPEGFICQICGKKLNSMPLLEVHVRKVHLKKPFNCNICKKSFPTLEIYDAHVASHDPSNDLTQKCHICGRVYGSISLMALHMKRHKERVAHSCVVCGKVTLRITQHMKIHTPRPKRVLCCSACGKLFNHSSGLSKHFKIMHKLPRPPPKPKKVLIATNGVRKRKRKSEVTDQLSKSKNAEMHEKEEEAKRVIVELIQNATYTPYLPDSYIDAPPPIAREETITAVNSIVTES